MRRFFPHGVFDANLKALRRILEDNMRAKTLVNLLAVPVVGLLLLVAAARFVEAASAGPTVTVYQSLT